MSGKTKQPKHKMSAMAKKEERTAWLFIALPFLGFLLFMAYPICFAVFAKYIDEEPVGEDDPLYGSRE